MSDRISARLEELGLVLPGPYPPHDPLDAVVVHAGRARTSGQLPRGSTARSSIPGVLGADSRSSRRRPRGGARSARCRCSRPSSGRSTE